MCQPPHAIPNHITTIKTVESNRFFRFRYVQENKGGLSRRRGWSRGLFVAFLCERRVAAPPRDSPFFTHSTGSKLFSSSRPFKGVSPQNHGLGQTRPKNLSRRRGGRGAPQSHRSRAQGQPLNLYFGMVVVEGRPMKRFCICLIKVFV